MTKAFTHMDATEKRLVAMWRKRKMTIPDIADLLGRDKGTISRHVRKTNTKQVGRPKALTDAEVKRLLAIRGRLVQQANCLYDVTMKTIRAHSKTTASERTIFREFRRSIVNTNIASTCLHAGRLAYTFM